MASAEGIPALQLGKAPERHLPPWPKFGRMGVEKVVKAIDKLHYLCLYLKPKEVAQMAQAYCFKCRTKREIKNPVKITLKNGRPATRGSCPSCGTKVFRIGG